MAEQYKHLFSPLKVGSFTVPNRMVSLPHGTYFDDKGLPSEKSIAYYLSKARGGVGLIIHEAVMVHHSSYFSTFARPNSVERFRRLSDAIHQHETKIVLQMAHNGVQFQATFETPWGPSVVPSPRSWYPPHEMTIPEVKEVVQAFGEAAARAREAGFDGAEVLAAHGYLVMEFMSPFFNRRKDEYGGDLENRLRFPLEVLNTVRQAVGDDFTIGLRISGDEMNEGGLTLDDMVAIAPILASQGKLDYINVSMGTYRAPSTMIDPMYYPLGSALYCAAAIKSAVDVPVIGRGRILDPLQAEQALANNQADLVGMARALIADPEIPNKARRGELDDIRTCLGCNECAGRVNYLAPMPLRCTTNTTVSMETQPGWLELAPAARQKKVVVIGGGPAGMELADIASRRGHRVSLYDRGQELGGAALIAAKAPGRDGLLEAVRYRVRRMQVDGVDVHLGVEMTAKDVEKLGAEVVVIATGSIPLAPDVVGLDDGNAIECRDLLSGKAGAGQNVIVIAGEHHIQALTVADFLASQGKKVELVCEEFSAGMHIDYLTRHAIYQRLYRQGVIFTPNSAVKEMRGNTVVVVNVMTREEGIRENVDTVVYACGGRENNALYYELQGKVKELYLVGDCAGVKRMIDAIRSASVLARRL